MDRATRQAVTGCWRMKTVAWIQRTGGFLIQAWGQVRHRVLATASRRMAGRFYRAEANTLGKKLAARVDHA